MEHTAAMLQLQYNRRLFQRAQPIRPIGHTVHANPARRQHQHSHQCGLLTLPRELRAVIYKHLFSHGVATPITLIKGNRFRTIGLPGASLLRTCRAIFKELDVTVTALRIAGSLDIRVVDTMAIPRRPCRVSELSFDGVGKVNVKILLSQLSEKDIITSGLSSLVQAVNRSSRIGELRITVSAMRSYTDQQHFDELVALLSSIRTEGNLELCWDSPNESQRSAKMWEPLSVSTVGFMKMRSEQLEYACCLAVLNHERKMLMRTGVHWRRSVVSKRPCLPSVMQSSVSWGSRRRMRKLWESWTYRVGLIVTDERSDGVAKMVSQSLIIKSSYPTSTQE